MPATASASHCFNLACFHIFHILSFSSCQFLLLSCFQGWACSWVFFGLLILSIMLVLTNQNISTDVVTFCNLVSRNSLFPHTEVHSSSVILSSFFRFLPECNLKKKNETFQNVPDLHIWERQFQLCC